MPRLKSLNGLALVFGAVVGQSTLAQAATTDLFCQENGTNRADGLNLSIDVNARTATAWTSGSARGDVHALPATVTADQVAWSAETSIGTFHYTLDRNSGVLTVLGPNRTGGIIPTTDVWSCARARPVL
jgi:hypothetical protein